MSVRFNLFFCFLVISSVMKPIIGLASRSMYQCIYRHCIITFVVTQNDHDFRLHDSASENSFTNTKKKVNPAKVRQHVNPLSSFYAAPIEYGEEWIDQSFEDITKPLIIDVGCARGSWALNFAELNQDMNFLGLEIRRPMIEYCLQRRDKRNLRNLHYLTANANVDLPNLLQQLKKRQIPINTINFQFPDPHFKLRHKKRRVVNTELVKLLSEKLPTGARVFVQSDVEELATDMASHLFKSDFFDSMEGYNIEELKENVSPFPVQTEREIATLRKDLPVYRMLFERNSKKS